MKIFLVVTGIVMSICFSTQANEITVVTAHTPPLNYEAKDGSVAGLSTDVVREILKRLNKPDNIQIIPWARGYLMAQDKPDVFLYSTTRTEQREKLFKWIGPLAIKNWVFFGKKGSGIKIHNLEEAKKVKRIGTVKVDPVFRTVV